MLLLMSVQIYTNVVFLGLFNTVYFLLFFLCPFYFICITDLNHLPDSDPEKTFFRLNRINHSLCILETSRTGPVCDCTLLAC